MKKTEATKYYLATFISIATFIVYLPGLQNDFVLWDDNLNVYDNPFIRSLDLTFLKRAFFELSAVDYWRPLTWLSHALDYAVWGLDPLGHHLTNNILHAFNTFVVVLLMIRLLESVQEKAIQRKQASFLLDRTVLIAAGATGLLFGLHPAHVESVAWVSERKDLLCALFFLLSIMAHTKYVISPILPLDKGRKEESLKRKRGKWYFLSLGFFVLALLSKPMAVTLPAVLLIIDWFPFERIPSSRALRAALVDKLPFIALSIASSLLAVLAQKAVGALSSMEAVPLSSRVFVAGKSLIMYLWKMILPLNLIPLYPYPGETSFISLEYLSALALAGGITIACIVLAKKRKLWLSVWGYYVITLLPVLGIVQVGRQSMADRYTYLPSLGPFLVIGLMAAWIWARTQKLQRQRLMARFLFIAICIIAVASLSYLTFKQIGIWKNSIVLWSYVIEKEPEKVPVAYYNRGKAFEKTGLLDRVIADYDRAIALNPSYYEAFNNRGLAFEKMGFPDKAITDYDRAIALNASLYEAFNNRGLFYQKMGLFEKAIKDLEAAMAMRQSSPEAYDNLGKIYSKTGRFDKAIENHNKAIALNPSYHEAYYNLAIVYEKKGQINTAIESYNRAIALNPSYYEAYNNLGILYANAALYDKAIEHFTEAIRLNQSQAIVYLNRGNIHYKIGNKELAVSDFQKACDLGNKAGCSALDAVGRGQRK